MLTGGRGGGGGGDDSRGGGPGGGGLGGGRLGGCMINTTIRGYQKFSKLRCSLMRICSIYMVSEATRMRA